MTATVIVKNNIGKLKENLKKAREAALRRGGSDLEGAIKDTISDGRGEWPALQPKTIARKGSSRPLIDTGALRSSITHVVEETSVKVGVIGNPSNIKTHDPIVTYAPSHEFGDFSRGIPERSFLRFTFNDEKENIKAAMAKEFKKAIDESTLK